MKTKRRILVTGCAGFIGSNLLARLLSYKDSYVIGIDNFSSGSKSNISKFYHSPSFEFHAWDVCNPYKSIE